MKANFQRILAIIGLVLILASIVLMMVGFFVGAAKELLLNISLGCFLGSVMVLLIISIHRKQAQPEQSEPKDEE